MPASGSPNFQDRVKVGSTVDLRVGPFYDDADELIDFSSGWTLTALVQGPDGVVAEYGASADGDGYFRWISGIDDVELTGLYFWTMRAVTLGSTERRYSDDGSFVATAEIP